MKLLVQGAASADAVPGLLPLPEGVMPVCAENAEQLGKALPGTEVVLGWNFRDSGLEAHWDRADSLKWIHWCGAGVDAALFPGLGTSDVILTNAGGIFDRAMAETVLGYMIYEAKDFGKTIDHQRSRIWEYRMTHQLLGDRVLVVGVGSIGREIARVLRSFGLLVSGAGRSERLRHPDFDIVYASKDMGDVVDQFDWVVGVMPSTAQTHGFFDARFFQSMASDARFINVGRGSAVVESDLQFALENKVIAGAFLDVFASEPLAADSPLWGLDNLFISPHISGDFVGFEAEMVRRFKVNLQRYLDGEVLLNVVDKNLGFVRAPE